MHNPLTCFYNLAAEVNRKGSGNAAVKSLRGSSRGRRKQKRLQALLAEGLRGRGSFRNEITQEHNFKTVVQVAHAPVAATCQHSVGARDLTRRVEDIGLRVLEKTSLVENPMPKKLANEMETRGYIEVCSTSEK